MAYRLSPVTADIRKRMVESIKKEIIHDKEKAFISTGEEKNEDKKQKKYMSNENKGKKRYLTVDAVKNEDKRLNVEAEIDEDILNDDSLGIFIDKKK